MKPLKSSYVALLVGAALSFSASSEAGPRFAGGEMTLEGSVSYTDTNKVSPRAYSSSDTFLTVTPTIRFKKESSTSNFSANLSTPIRRYDESDYLDSETLIFDISGEMPFGSGPKLSGNWSISYFDGVRSNYDTNSDLNTESLNLNLNADYVLRNKLSVRARAGYIDRNNSGIDTSYGNSNKSDYYALGLHSRDFIRGRVGLYAEYRIQNRQTDGGNVDEKDDGLNFGITGQILPERLFPKLEADLSFGLASVDRLNGSSERLTLDGRLAYPANAKTNVVLTYRRNLSVTDDDRSVERGQLNISLDYTPRQKLTFITRVGLETSDYLSSTSPRKDDILTFGISGRYQIKTNWFSELSFNYRDSDSTRVISDYSSGQATLSSTIVF